MSNRTTGAQRYNKRMDAIFEQGKINNAAALNVRPKATIIVSHLGELFTARIKWGNGQEFEETFTREVDAQEWIKKQYMFWLLETMSEPLNVEAVC